MEKPTAFVHLRKMDKFDMGVLVVGNRALPTYVLASGGLILTVTLLAIGGIVAGATEGQNWGVLASAAIPAVLTVGGLIIGGIVTLVHSWIRNTRIATEILRGTRKDSRY